MAIKFDIYVMSKTPSAAHLAQACAALWNDIQADPDYWTFDDLDLDAGLLQIWNDIQADPDYWTATDEILNAYLVQLCELGTRTYGPENFGWALMGAGLSKDDAETCVDRTIPDKTNVYADNADIWEMAFNRS